MKMRRCEDVKMRRCEDEKMRYRPPLLEEPCAQTLSHGESFQCSECGDLFLTTMVKWGAFLEQVKENHPGAKKPQRSERLVDVDGNVKPSGQKHNQFRRGGGFKRKRHVDQAGNVKFDAKPVGPQ